MDRVNREASGLGPDISECDRHIIRPCFVAYYIQRLLRDHFGSFNSKPRWSSQPELKHSRVHVRKDIGAEAAPDQKDHRKSDYEVTGEHRPAQLDYALQHYAIAPLCASEECPVVLHMPVSQEP